MEEALTDCLIRVRDDLTNLNVVRDYLDGNRETEVQCRVTWRTIEAFNSILGVCSSQQSPQTNALDTLLDSFYYLARNNTDHAVWNDFGFELGIICVKVLSAIERSEIFEVLFCKLLTVINVICEHNTSVWKSTARQILNVFINKKFSLSYLETVLKLYVCILRNVESSALCNFSSQNHNLLKTFSMLVQKVGDFEIQSDIVELVFLHLSNKTEPMSDFFSATEKKLFETLPFADFEGDCRIYLNAINKPRGGFERKVYSVRCQTMYLGGCHMEPPVRENVFWVDANKETERLSFRCADVDSDSNRVIYVLFSDLLHLNLSNEKSEEYRCLTIHTKSLRELQFNVKNDEICLMLKNGEDLLEFVNFLNGQINTKNKFNSKLSKTKSSLFIDRNKIQMLQDNAITSSEKRGIDQKPTHILNLFEKAESTTTTNETQFKSSQSSKIPKSELKSPLRSQERKVFVPSQELSPNSFVESLNQHIGRDSPDIPHTFEDSVETIEFLKKSQPAPHHKLFRCSEKIFDVIKTEDPNNFSFIFDENKENAPKLRTYERKREESKPKQLANFSQERVLRDRKDLEAKLANTQSQDYFQLSMRKKKKPSLPKFKRNTKTTNQEVEISENKKNKQKRQRQSVEVELTKIPHESKEERIREVPKENQGDVDKEIEQIKTQRKLNVQQQKRQSERRSNWEITEEKKTPKQQPSLLDPNGYAFRRWCTPTTSERSNFWLKKLNAKQTAKIDNNTVFDFSEDSDSVPSKSKKKKRRVIHSKRKCKIKETKQTSLREVKEIIKKTSPKRKEPIFGVPEDSIRSKEQSKSPECSKVCDVEPQQCDSSSKRSFSSVSIQQGTTNKPNGELHLPDEEEEENVPSIMKKRERSDEETSQSRNRKKKKSKAVLPSRKLLTKLRHRLKKREHEDREQTNEIIQTVNKAVSHLFNHLQRKEGQTIMSYLTAAEEATGAVESDVGDLNLRAKRIQRALLYFEAGCSVSDMCDSVEEHFSCVRAALKEFSHSKDFSRAIIQMNERLEGLIKSGIEKQIDRDMATRRKKLLKCASIFGGDFGDFNEV